jgi:small-conductance mechanosensitive channel
MDQEKEKRSTVSVPLIILLIFGAILLLALAVAYKDVLSANSGRLEAALGIAQPVLAAIIGAIVLVLLAIKFTKNFISLMTLIKSKNK